MRLLRGILLKPVLNLLCWLLRREGGNSLIIGGPLGWSWEATLDTAHHGSLEGPANAHRHSDLANVGIDDHHARDHAARHGSGEADAVTLDASQIGTGRFGMPRMPDGEAEKVLIAQGAGSDPAYGDPIPKADSESGNFTYTTGYGTDETDISALFTTPLTGTERRKYTVYLDLTNFEVDGDFDEVYVAVKARIDGANYRPIDRKTIAKADIAANAEPGVPIMIPAVAQDVQITFQLSVALASNRAIYYHYVKEFLE